MSPSSCEARRTEEDLRYQGPLDADETVVKIVGPFDFVVANAGGHGDYRPCSRRLFSDLLDHLDSLGDIERYSLVSDTWAMVRSAQVPASAFLDLVGRFVDETEHAIWSVIMGENKEPRSTMPGRGDPTRSSPSCRPWSVLRWTASPGRGRATSDLTRKLRGDLIAGAASWATTRPPLRGHARLPATSSREASSIPRSAPPLSPCTHITVGPRSTRRCGPRTTKRTLQPKESAISARWPGSRWRNWP